MPLNIYNLAPRLRDLPSQAVTDDILRTIRGMRKRGDFVDACLAVLHLNSSRPYCFAMTPGYTGVPPAVGDQPPPKPGSDGRRSTVAGGVSWGHGELHAL